VGVALAALFLVAQAIWWTEPVAVFDALQWALPNVVWRVHTTEPFVALSFDDGPHAEHTPEVLAILAQHGAHATFFAIGQRAAAHPELLAAMKAGGHEVGNHYLHRGTALGDSTTAFVAKLARTEQIIGLRQSPKLFRPPGGLAWPWQLREARERGYTCVLGSAYPHDPAHPPVRYIRWLITKNMVPGSIVILHDGISDPSRSIQALPDILAEGERRGIRFVTVGELLARRTRDRS
jgi:peptidoglycan/xylan/chitin deacetylase (PgdA/CDA1 family)